MFEFDKLCKEYETLTYDERRLTLSSLSDIVLPAIEKVTHGTESFELLVLASCAADGKLGVEEYSLFKDATGMDFSYDAAEELIKNVKGKNLFDAADVVVDTFGTINPDVKAAMVSFCLCLCSADNKVTLKEKAFIKKLIRQ